jgi:hypothetical protein
MNSKKITLNCSHHFCSECLTQLYKSDLQQKCPICRQPIINKENTDLVYDAAAKFYVHFENKETCKRFMSKNIRRVGNSCCSGKGCHVIIASSQDEANTLKNTFLNSPLEQKRKKIEEYYKNFFNKVNNKN